ncbi:MAG: DUF3842 family protein [Clostridia bacterium]|nr:DUF3842 family protein [Clostridia bacterium]
MKKIVIIDGQGGRIGTQLIAALHERDAAAEIIAIGTNSIATANMLKSAPDAAATGENPVVVACRDADVIAGPLGIVIADSLYGEITPKMARSVGQSRAARVLIPMSKCDNVVVGVGEVTLGELIREAAETILSKIKHIE